VACRASRAPAGLAKGIHPASPLPAPQKGQICTFHDTDVHGEGEGLNGEGWFKPSLPFFCISDYGGRNCLPTRTRLCGMTGLVDIVYSSAYF